MSEGSTPRVIRDAGQLPFARFRASGSVGYLPGDGQVTPPAGRSPRDRVKPLRDPSLDNSNSRSLNGPTTRRSGGRSMLVWRAPAPPPPQVVPFVAGLLRTLTVRMESLGGPWSSAAAVGLFTGLLLAAASSRRPRRHDGPCRTARDGPRRPHRRILRQSDSTGASRRRRGAGLGRGRIAVDDAGEHHRATLPRADAGRIHDSLDAIRPPGQPVLAGSPRRRLARAAIGTGDGASGVAHALCRMEVTASLGTCARGDIDPARRLRGGRRHASSRVREPRHLDARLILGPPITNVLFRADLSSLTAGVDFALCEIRAPTLRACWSPPAPPIAGSFTWAMAG